MNNNSLDDIVKISIEISSPAQNMETFDTILMIVQAPVQGGRMERTSAISAADELAGYGFTTEDMAYRAASVAFSQTPVPDRICVCVRKQETDAENNTTYESITDTLTRAASEAGFYGVYLCGFDAPEDISEAMAWAESSEKLFAFEYTDYDSLPVSNFGYYRTFGLYSGSADTEAEEPPVENRFAALAWMAKCFGYDPGTETWHMKELATVVPSALNTQQKRDLESRHINRYMRYGGCNITIGGYTLAGEWIDVIRFRDWLKAEMQTNIFNVLKVNRKVPYTDAGIQLIAGKMEETLKKGQSVGGIAEDAFDADGNRIYGFRVTVPRASDLTEAQRKSRKLTGCKYTARLAGAIHAVEIEGYLTF